MLLLGAEYYELYWRCHVKCSICCVVINAIKIFVQNINTLGRGRNKTTILEAVCSFIFMMFTSNFKDRSRQSLHFCSVC